MLKRRIKSTVSIVFLLVLLVGIVFPASPQQVAADPGEPGPFGRRLNYGFFWNQRFTQGDDVIPGGIHSSNLNQFINDIRGRASNWGGGWSLQNIRGAQFIIQTMRGGPNALPSVAEIDDWEARVRSLVASGGRIEWDDRLNFNINSYWQRPGPAAGDDAFYTINHGAYVWNWWGVDPDGVPVGTSIGFYNSAGSLLYAIRKACGNPVSSGSLPPAADFNLTPNITSRVNGVAATQAEAGDTITFDYSISNSGSTNSYPATCTGGAFNRVGYFQTPPTPEAGGTPLPLNCSSRVFPPFSNTSVMAPPESIVAVANRTYCRTLFVSPRTQAGGSLGTERCISVVSRPYLKVFGGDVSSGGNVETAPDTCSVNGGASIIAWNRANAPGYAGAGTQYAASTVNVITHFATGQRLPGGMAPAGLSFANTAANIPAGNYGGNFGTANCIKDHYGQIPASGLEGLGSIHGGVGTYSANGNVTLGGLNVNPNDRITIYVNGNLSITNNITFMGNWNTGNMPHLKIVVLGNIYVGSSVSRLDGVYIAQPNGGTNGTIYTCANGFAAPPFNVAYYSLCGGKLTVNGSFVARDIQFLRTFGSLNASADGEGPGDDSIAEEFNYGPAFWMAQPASTSSEASKVDNYDAIISLPPVL